MLNVYSTKNKNSSGFLHDTLELHSPAHTSWRFAQGESWKVEKFRGNKTGLPLSRESSSAMEKMLQLFAWCNLKINSLLLSELLVSVSWVPSQTQDVECKGSESKGGHSPLCGIWRTGGRCALRPQRKSPGVWSCSHSSLWVQMANPSAGQCGCACLWMILRQQSRNYGADSDIRNSHRNVLCCSSPHRVAGITLQWVQNYSAYASPPKCKMENAMYYQRYLLGLIIYDTSICNMFPSVRSSIDGLGNSI